MSRAIVPSGLPRSAWGVGVLGLSLLALGLLGADGPVALVNTATGEAERLLGRSIGLLDLASGKDISGFLLGALLILAAFIANLLLRRPLLSGRLLFVGSVQFLSTCIADFSKPVFGRMRPFQAILDGGWTDHWFMGGHYGSFPSGHVAFYAGLCVPLAFLFPRWSLAFLAVLLLVGIERVVSNDHYLSDVGASLLLATLVAAAAWKLMRRERIVLAPDAAVPIEELA